MGEKNNKNKQIHTYMEKNSTNTTDEEKKIVITSLLKSMINLMKKYSDIKVDIYNSFISTMIDDGLNEEMINEIFDEITTEDEREELFVTD